MKGRKREVRGRRKKNQLQRRHLPGTLLDWVKVALPLLAVSALQAGQCQFASLGDPADQLWQPPLLSCRPQNRWWVVTGWSLDAGCSRAPKRQVWGRLGLPLNGESAPGTYAAGF